MGPPASGGSARARTQQRAAFILAVWTSAWAAVACGMALIVSGPLGLADGTEGIALLSLGAACTIGGGLTLGRLRAPQSPAPMAVFVAACGTWAAMVAISTVAYLATGTTGSPADAIFESVAGFCTTNLSVLADLASVGHGVLFWRASTQWLGGFASLVLLAAALPLYVPVLSLPGEDGAAQDRHSVPPFGTQLRRLAAVYGTVSVLCAGAYAAVGMGAFDAVTYAFTTVSTGGFGNHDAGLGQFGSTAVEWVAVAFMALAGVSVVTLWWVLRGRPRVLRQSFELRIYLAVLVVATALLTIWTWDAAGGVAALRRSAFNVTAAMSSTGFGHVDASGWIWGAQILLLALIATGGMAGTAGGGLRLRPAIAAVRYAYRELVTEIHPHTVHVVKIGRRSVPEGTLALLNGYQVLFAVAVLAGVFGLGLAGMDLWAGASASISALATTGPAPGADLGALGGGEQIVLAVLMVLGRLSFFPLIVVAGGAVTGTRRLLLSERSNGRRTHS